VSSPFIGEIRMFGGNFAPAGWALCDGAIMPISENDALFNLIGTTYGGDGEVTFALPNLQSRIPVHAGPGYVLGEAAGVESVTLTVSQIPNHNHLAGAAATATGTSPAGAVPAAVTVGARYFNGAPSAPVKMVTSSPVGGSQPHDNMAPFLCINFIISLFGIFPSQT
jgi:microcystin-dependent protein